MAAGEPAPRLATLPEDFWAQRPVLAHIRAAAHSRGRSPDVALFALLARASAMVPHTVRFDTGVGDPAGASLNLFVSPVGPSGVGKTSGVAVARSLLPVPAWLVRAGFHDYDGLPIGSGEGLAEAYMGTVEEPTRETYKSGPRKGEPKTERVRKQVRHNVFFHTDEGEAITKTLERAGATIGPALRSAWSGELLGQSNAREETTRRLPAGSYAMGAVVGFQATTVRALLADATAGTPQRFLFCAVSDPAIPDGEVDHPGELKAELPDPFDSAPSRVTFTASVRAEIRAEDLARARGTVVRADLDAHVPLMRAKVAALLCLLEGRRVATEEDWQLSGVVWDTSAAVRDALVNLGRREEAVEREARTRSYVEREVRAKAAVDQVPARIERIARRIAWYVHDDAGEFGGRVRQSKPYKSLPSRDRALFAEGLEYATAQGWVTQNSMNDLEPGDSKPAQR